MKVMKKMTPLVMATMMLAPSVLLENAYAQQRERGYGNGGQVEAPRTSTEGIVQLQDADALFRSYIGTQSFKLEEDSEVRNATSQFNSQHKAYEEASKSLSEKKDALQKALDEKTKIQDEVSKLEKAIASAVTEKAQIEQQLPNLKKQLNEINKQVQVAQKAFDVTKEDRDAAQVKLEAAETELATKQEECKATPSAACEQQEKEAKQKVAAARKVKQDAQQLFATAKEDLTNKKAQKDAKQTEINEKEQKVASIEAENTKRANELNGKNSQLSAADQKVKVASNQVAPAQNDYNSKLAQRNKTATELNLLKERLAIRAVRLNKIGAEVGEEAGSVDGDYYAEYVGVPKGQLDGDRDGRESGTSAGQTNSYNQGIAQGEVEGNSQAQIDGFDTGKLEGTRAGHVAIATERGTTSGTQRAQGSDATQVGTRQGAAAGLDRAVQTGKTVGTKKGQSEAIEKNESDASGSSNVSGQFAGAFAAHTPEYPGFNCVRRGTTRYSRDQYEWRNFNDWQADRDLCPNFKPNQHADMANTNKEIFKKAFMDGYLVRYRGARRQQYVRSIESYYAPMYNQSRNAAFADYSSRTYPDFVEQGRQKGYLSAYNSTYPGVRDRYFNDFYNSSFSNPDTSNTDYVSTYRNVEGNTFSNVYEEMRSAAFNRQEQSTFDQNIGSQTEKYRQQRFAQVDAIYANHPVLKFESSEIYDGGINGVAKNDGIFQPGEKVLHSVTIKNFGKQAATAVKVKVDGKEFNVPSIAAKSTVTVKGVAESSIAANLGATNESTLQVFSPIEAEAEIQGRHFYATSANRLNFGDKKAVAVKYPINLAGLRTKNELLINNKNGLQLNASNISNRKYTGNLDIELTVDSSTNIITKPFNSLNGLSGSTTLNDAQILVASERDVYTPLNFSAKIKQNGVTIGILPGTYQTMAKAPFTDKAGKPVIVANSDKSADDLVKVISSYGGLAGVSVLDTTLDSLNSSVYSKGLDKKSVIVIDDTRGSTVEAMRKVLQKLEDSSVVYVDYSGRGLSQALANAKELKHAAKLPNMIDGFSDAVNLHFTNSFIDGVADMNVVAQANLNNYKQMVKALAQFNFTKNEIIPAAGNALNASNYKTVNSTIRTMISMAGAEVVNASLAYKASGENKEIVKFIESSNPIFKRILDQSGKKVSKSSLSKNLAAIAMWKVLDKAVDSFDPMDDNVDSDIESPFEDAMKDMMQGEGIRIFSKGTWNYLKSFDKDLYNTIDDNPYVHSPFKL